MMTAANDQVTQARRELHAKLMENSRELNRVNPSLDPERARSLIRQRKELQAARAATE